MTVAIFVEGKTDRDSIKAFFAKLHDSGRLQASATYRVLGSREAVLDTEKVCAFVNYQVLPQHRDLTGAVACVDMNCHTSEELEAERAAVDAITKSAALAVPLEYHFVRFAIESWLAADQAAWETVFRGAGSSVLPSNVLELCHPKDEIRRHLKARGRDFSYVQHDARLAAEINLSTAERMCPNFSEFIERVIRLSS